MQKALFLDRDGVINVEKDYLYKIEDFEFIDGIFELCRHFQDKGYKIFVVTNQSGIARKYYTEDDFNTLTSWMVKEFVKNGIEIQKVEFCPHHPNITGECSCRKPSAGMLESLQKKFNLDMPNSIIVGDKESDIEAGLNAGLKETYLFDEICSVKNSKATKIISNLKDVYNVDFK